MSAAGNYEEFYINQNLYNIERNTETITLDGKKTQCWYVGDMYNTYKKLGVSSKSSFSEFYKILQRNTKFIFTEHNDMNKTVVSLKDKYLEEVVSQIMKQNITTEAVRGKSPFDAIGMLYESDEDDEIFSDSAPVVPSSKKKQTEKNFSRKRDNDHSNSYNKKEPQKLLASKKFDISKIKNYDGYRDMMLTSLDKAPVFSITSFHEIIKSRYGITFDHKTAISYQGKYRRSKLFSYLDECKDIFQKIQMGSVLFYKRIDNQCNFLIDKRKSAHLKAFTNEKTQYHIEILIVNMFMVKTTCEMVHVEKIFEMVYKVPLTKILGGFSFKDFLRKVSSPNMIVKGNVNCIRLTCIPTHHEEYKLYQNEELHQEVLNIEDDICQTKSETLAVENVTVPEVVVPTYNFNIKYSDVFKTKDEKLLAMLDLADYNIPRVLQNKHTVFDTTALISACESDFGIDPLYFAIYTNVKTDGNRTFFNSSF
ncbi:hypothetical protein EDEG_01706 [Edhazardia aedis USNM 41457]|uniref:Uncharacterized protein n=1 Tax=Edhazardia aedis (strain USNM 41457) TaxID=1003232 RepID=J9DN81_EDHAE|nr:hypothetical protein EDEG_01706 [Edhazardia aedis USNM 41457]|eukprot:EJW03995.1 hypothetical protein EDEG_01706 [Edhazardia aedis USNM 41457]